MFTKKGDKDGVMPERSKPALVDVSPAAVTAAPRSSARRGVAATSTIAADLMVTGNLKTQGEIQIDGEVQGDVHASRIIVGEGARITGSLLADEIVVRGNVAGSVRGNRVTLQANSRVEGDLFHRSLAIEQGAFFEGKSRRSDNPTQLPRTSEAVTPRREVPAPT
jgi:cytoskeletal protein CcmA (bactofilin family)